MKNINVVLGSLGLACSQDVFQKRMDQILEDCEGCIGITDDITIHGCTEAEHDVLLWKHMEVAQKYGLMFNPKKTQVKAPMVKLFRCIPNEPGVHPDPEKVDAVHALPTPTNITELQEVWFRTYVNGRPFTLNLTISHWNQSLRRALQIHLPSCPTCFYACKGMIMFSATGLERKWPSKILFHVSSSCLSTVWKEALQLGFEMDVEMCALTDIIISG